MEIGLKQCCTSVASMSLISAVLLLAMVSTSAHGEGQQHPCSVKALMPCLQTVKGPYPPEPDHTCCIAVMEANPSCLCSEYVNSNFSPNFIKNVLAMPKACGRTNLSGFHCGIYTID
ncbi:uncharacterized protein [Physcomitrium patens]|uniref:uncharacterized protein n=1 Tax=Physcomitrium patens TaxID=3218 RepID=UPI00024B11EB|nr:uncharacterized protein LOC112283370 [Physcomitrium patens]|eukprot:XP_024377737.1 uncharacterized protein LOC112283370 [Physcomitrella patens]